MNCVPESYSSFRNKVPGLFLSNIFFGKVYIITVHVTFQRGVPNFTSPSAEGNAFLLEGKISLLRFPSIEEKETSAQKEKSEVKSFLLQKEDSEGKSFLLSEGKFRREILPSVEGKFRRKIFPSVRRKNQKENLSLCRRKNQKENLSVCQKENSEGKCFPSRRKPLSF